jgi:protein PhnA
MTHYICRGGCGGVLEEIGICETDGCANQWEMMEECDCADGEHGASQDDNAAAENEAVVVKDCNGNELNEGDNVALTKDLDVKGSAMKLKRGDVIRNIRLIAGDAENVEFKAGKSTMVLKTCFAKKL